MEEKAWKTCLQYKARFVCKKVTRIQERKREVCKYPCDDRHLESVARILFF